MERIILSSVLKFEAHIIKIFKRRLARYINGKLNSSRIKRFKPISNILMSNNYKLNLLEQCKDSTTKKDIDERIATLKMKLENINDKNDLCTPKESIFINDIFMKTNKILNNIYYEIDYKGKYYKITEKLDNEVICTGVGLLNINSIYHYKPLGDSKGFITYNLIKIIDFAVKELNKCIYLAREKIIKNDETFQRRKRIHLIEQENMNQPKSQFYNYTMF